MAEVERLGNKRMKYFPKMIRENSKINYSLAFQNLLFFYGVIHEK